MHRESLCPLCGKPLEECTSVEGEGPDFKTGWMACRATMAKLEFQRAQSGDSKTPDPNAGAYLYSAETLRR